MRQRLEWSEHRTLHGVTVAVTRARVQASALAARLRALGAEVVEAPAIRIVPIPGDAPEVERYDLVCLTSPNGVRFLFERLAAAGRDARALAGATGRGDRARDGGGAARARRDRRRRARAVRRRGAGGGVGRRARSACARGPRGRGARRAARRAARSAAPRSMSWRCTRRWRSRSARTRSRPWGGVDYVTFTSSSTVTFFFDVAGDRLSEDARLVSIGPVTSAALAGPRSRARRRGRAA